MVRTRHRTKRGYSYGYGRLRTLRESYLPIKKVLLIILYTLILISLHNASSLFNNSLIEGHIDMNNVSRLNYDEYKSCDMDISIDRKSPIYAYVIPGTRNCTKFMHSPYYPLYSSLLIFTLLIIGKSVIFLFIYLIY